MSRSKRIYVDVDDVVSRTTETYTRIVREEFGRTVPFENLTTFDLRASFQLTDNEFHYFFDLVHQHDLLLGFAPVDGAIDVLNAWSGQGHCIEIVTGRPTSARDVTLEWLDRHGVTYNEFIMVDKYNRPGNDPAVAVSKSDLAARTYDLAVEDSGEMALFLAEEMGVTTALKDRPWNRGCTDHDRLVRCMSWEDIKPLAT
ncbi:MAG: bifunctional metallophosphatase/5'-nucleotidase [Desulfobacterales bacterium]|nr:bifunctional metallophosphatase/5'-nucleotidase [Desulfobacterales bacterium]